jgi:hypothetical protein
MAISYDTSAYHGGTNATSITFAHVDGVGSNRILWVGILTGGGDTVTGVTYNGVAMTQASKNTSMPSTNVLYLYYLVNPATGSNNIVVSQTGSGYLNAASTSYFGASQTGQPDASTTNYSAATSALTTTVTTIADNCWTVMAGRAMDSSTISAGTGTTLRVGTYLVCMLDSNGPKTPAGSTSLVFINNTGRVGSAMASFSPFVSAPTVTPFRRIFAHRR